MTHLAGHCKPSSSSTRGHQPLQGGELTACNVYTHPRVKSPQPRSHPQDLITLQGLVW